MNNIKLPYSEIEAEIEANPMIMPDSVIEITENGRYNVAKYSFADVNVEGGGYSWQTVFEGSVTTEQFALVYRGEIPNYSGSTADTIKVTFNGVEYTCSKNGDGTYGAFDGEDGWNWDEYPFAIYGDSLVTPDAGTYTLKIEEPQSGDSDLTWILPEQTVTLVDQPVEITGLRLDLIPNSVRYVALKSTSAELGGNITCYYSLQYFDGELATDSGEIFISNIDGKYMFGVTDGESIASNTYTISIALF